MIPARSKEITSDWLNDVLHASGFLGDINIESMTHEPWGVGEGFVSDMARLTAKYDRDAPHLPRTMIAKLPTTYESARAVAMLFNLYEREIRFYSEVAPQSPIRTPGLIYYDIDSESQRYILIMEDCSGYTQIDQIVGLDYEQTKRVTLMIADFHAHWWDADNLFSFPWMPKPKGPETMALIDTYRGCWDFSAQSEEFKSFLPDGGYQAGVAIHKHFPWLVEDVRDNNITIAHFDFRVDNMFFDFENTENPIIVFDWGTAVVNAGILDLAYLLGGSITIELRRKIEKEIVQLYLDRLSEKGISGYSFDDCWTDYLKGLMCYAYIPALGFTSLDLSDERAVQLGEAIVKRHFTAIVDNDATNICP